MPSATDRKNSATIWVRNFAGASLVDSDRPTGESSSSEIVKKSSTPTRPSSGALLAPPPAIGMNSRNDTPMLIVPSANFTGLDGCRSPSLVHIVANTPASTMMKTGLIDCTHGTGISQPNRLRSSRSSE